MAPQFSDKKKIRFLLINFLLSLAFFCALLNQAMKILGPKEPIAETICSFSTTEHLNPLDSLSPFLRPTSSH